MLSNRTTYIKAEIDETSVKWMKSDKDDCVFEVAPMTRGIQYKLASQFKSPDFDLIFDFIKPYVVNRNENILFENIDLIDLKDILDIWWSNNQLSAEEITRFLS